MPTQNTCHSNAPLRIRIELGPDVDFGEVFKHLAGKTFDMSGLEPVVIEDSNATGSNKRKKTNKKGPAPSTPSGGGTQGPVGGAEAFKLLQHHLRRPPSAADFPADKAQFRAEYSRIHDEFLRAHLGLRPEDPLPEAARVDPSQSPSEEYIRLEKEAEKYWQSTAAGRSSKATWLTR